MFHYNKNILFFSRTRSSRDLYGGRELISSRIA